jgi:hypothetical protein
MTILKKDHSAYTAWKGMLNRCRNPKYKCFEHYGGRGITVCDSWKTFENFAADMGDKPSPKHSLDRIDNDGNYCPENCRWATPIEQHRNRRNTIIVQFNGQDHHIADLADAHGMDRKLLHHRLKEGWSVERALAEPVRAKFPKQPKVDKPHGLSIFLEHDGEQKPLRELAKTYGIQPEVLYGRVFVMKWALDRALTQAVRSKKKGL